jgi:hypothetical protein
MPDVFDVYFARSPTAEPQPQNVVPGLPGQQRSIDMKSAFFALRAAKLALYESSEKAISAKAALDKKKSELLASDTIQGKNAETREAKLAQECWPEMATLEAAEAEKRKAAHEADQVALVVSEIQWLIRNDEATAALVRERII